MSIPVPGRWIAASRWSNRVDLRPVFEHLGGPDAFLRATGPALKDAGLSDSAVRALITTPEQLGSDPWTHLGSPSYPRALLDLRRPPPVIWLRGDQALLSAPGVGVVGTRTCTAYGRRIAHRIAGVVSREGGVVVSGAAWGIDACAHRGAAGGRTIAVLGAGLEASASQAARRLREEVLTAGGLLISEMAPVDPGARWTFPRRNRLIAALSRCCVVVEAGERSGALITARQAAALGRPIFAVPGPMDAPASAGPLRLIAAGASCLTSMEPLLGQLQGATPDSPAARLRRALVQPGSASELARRTGLSLSGTMGALALLELTREVRRLPDQRYALR